MIARLLEQDEAVQAILSSDWKTRHLIATLEDIHVWESFSIPIRRAYRFSFWRQSHNSVIHYSCFAQPGHQSIEGDTR